jgi:flagellar biogenesis protein FliO
MRGFIVLSLLAIVFFVGLLVWLVIKVLTSRRNPSYLLSKQAMKALRQADEASKNGRHGAAEGYMQMYESLQRQLDKR